jgi:hypothetical protein
MNIPPAAVEVMPDISNHMITFGIGDYYELDYRAITPLLIDYAVASYMAECERKRSTALHKRMIAAYTAESAIYIALFTRVIQNGDDPPPNLIQAWERLHNHMLGMRLKYAL